MSLAGIGRIWTRGGLLGNADDESFGIDWGGGGDFTHEKIGEEGVHPCRNLEDLYPYLKIAPP